MWEILKKQCVLQIHKTTLNVYLMLVKKKDLKTLNLWVKTVINVELL